MENTRDKYKALLASLGVHLIIFFIAAAVGVFSMATLKEKSDNVEVVIYDEAQDEGSEGGGSGGGSDWLTPVPLPPVPGPLLSPMPVPTPFPSPPCPRGLPARASRF